MYILEIRLNWKKKMVKPSYKSTTFLNYLILMECSCTCALKIKKKKRTVFYECPTQYQVCPTPELI